MHDFVEALLRKERAEHTYPGKLPDSEFWDALAGSLSDIARRPDSMVMWQSMLNEDSSGSEDEAEAYDQDDYEDLGECLSWHGSLSYCQWHATCFDSPPKPGSGFEVKSTIPVQLIARIVCWEPVQSFRTGITGG